MVTKVACVDCIKEANPDIACYHNPNCLADACEKHLRENVSFWKAELDKLSLEDREKYQNFTAETESAYKGWLGEFERRGLELGS